MNFKKIIVLCCLALSNILTYAQTLKITTDEKERKGFVDENGEIVIKCKYDDVTPFNEDGVSVVKKGDNFGMIDKRGKEVLKIAYVEISPFFKGVARVNNGGKWGLVKSDGTFVLKPKYDYISQFNSNGLAWMAVDMKVKNGVIEKALYGLVDYKGKELAKPLCSAIFYEKANNKKSWNYPIGLSILNLDLKKYKQQYGDIGRIRNFDDVIERSSEFFIFTLAKNENGPGLMKSDGTIIVSPSEKIKSGLSYPSNGMYSAYSYDEKKRTLTQYYASVDGCKKIDVNTETFKKKPKMFELYLWGTTKFYNNVACVCKQNPDNKLEMKGYVINRDGKVIVEDMKTFNEPSEGKMILTNSKDEYGVLSTDGKVLIDFGTYAYIYDFYNDFAAVKKEEKWGYIDSNCELKIPARNESIMKEMNKYHYAIVKNNGKWGVESAEGKELIPFEYINMGVMDDKTFWVTKTDSLTYFYDLPTKKIITQGFKATYSIRVSPDSIAQLKNDMAVVSPATAKSDREVILVKRTGEVLFPLTINVDYKNMMLQCVEDNDGKPVSKGLAHSVVLKTTRNERSYSLSKTISDDDWDF